MRSKKRFVHISWPSLAGGYRNSQTRLRGELSVGRKARFPRGLPSPADATGALLGDSPFELHAECAARPQNSLILQLHQKILVSKGLESRDPAQINDERSMNPAKHVGRQARQQR